MSHNKLNAAYSALGTDPTNVAIRKRLLDSLVPDLETHPKSKLTVAFVRTKIKFLVFHGIGAAAQKLE